MEHRVFHGEYIKRNSKYRDIERCLPLHSHPNSFLVIVLLS